MQFAALIPKGRRPRLVLLALLGAILAGWPGGWVAITILTGLVLMVSAAVLAVVGPEKPPRPSADRQW